MLSEEEKQRILERVEYERELRAALSPEEKKPEKKEQKSVWDVLNSGIVLLLVTSMVSALIVPYFQRHQEQIDWKRQIRADNIKFKLGMMRDGLKGVQQRFLHFWAIRHSCSYP
jgi:hypothetical protein